MAMKYHPDKNPGDKNAEEKFKEASRLIIFYLIKKKGRLTIPMVMRLLIKLVVAVFQRDLEDLEFSTSLKIFLETSEGEAHEDNNRKVRI